jgi:hypothetical protein
MFKVYISHSITPAWRDITRNDAWDVLNHLRLRICMNQSGRWWIRGTLLVASL